MGEDPKSPWRGRIALGILVFMGLLLMLERMIGLHPGAF
jgi:hypothetical protein